MAVPNTMCWQLRNIEHISSVDENVLIIFIAIWDPVVHIALVQME